MTEEEIGRNGIPAHQHVVIFGKEQETAEGHGLIVPEPTIDLSPCGMGYIDAKGYYHSPISGCYQPVIGVIALVFFSVWHLIH